ncbi:HK97 family phage prohead protease [Pimelobacter simplex]|uniref:HK97 family phage prohead protease n=1 Tax=Nocardioides simplex TaxID=2045 RepID=UPI00214F81E9|nr:HK97 family phage prohead protease [Pimelobacter simplex]UUW92675.1 HK97 family phage prohead protease [Pimelobacter simplex]UUW96503.1 HK97 family phage prohead protease [Pimelobacter simplex]
MSNRRRRRGINFPAVTANAGSSLVLAAPGQQAVDTNKRTISGLVVPFGPAGETSGGRLRFKAGSLTFSDPRRVKLLREHDQRDVLGYATELVEREDGSQGPGLYATFHVPEGDDGDRALAEAANGLRDAFSVGVQLNDATLQRLRRTQPGGTVDAAGALREVSQVSVPAFDDARVAAAAGADLVVSSWSPSTPTDPSAAGAGTTTASAGGSMKFTEAKRRRMSQLLAKGSALANAEQTELGQLTQLATAAGITITGATITGDVEVDDAGDGESGDGDAGASASGSAQAGAQLGGPAVVPAVAGAAVVVAEPSTYTFSGDGPSLIRDLYAGSMQRDADAAQRVEQFNAQLADENPATVAALMTAASTRGDVDGVGGDLPPSWGAQPTNRPDLMKAMVDVRRPFASRLNRIPITNAQPFAIPKVGEFDGVGDHTEGTPHRPAGTFSLSGDVVQPVAVSGAWEASRELLDAGNPALDRVAIRAMARDYARKSEGKLITLFNAFAATEANNVYDVATTLKVRAALLNFVNDDEEPADLLAVSKGLLVTLGLDVDDVNRPQLPFVAPSNTTGTLKPGGTGFSIDGVEAFRSARLDTGGANLGAGSGVMARSESILFCESSVAQFRFDEVLGPGVIKFALWAYNGTALLDTADVRILKAGADPTP